MAECMAPVANADISGIGVRLAYYLQTLITVISALLGTKNEVGTAGETLLTITMINLAYCLGTLLSIYQPSNDNGPKTTLYDSLIVTYMIMFSSWYTWPAMVAYFRKKGHKPHVLWIAGLHNLAVCITVLVIITHLLDISSEDELRCRKATAIFIKISTERFRQAALGIVIFTLGIVSVCLEVLFMAMHGEQSPRWEKLLGKLPGAGRHKRANVAKTFLFVTWPLLIIHVELLRWYNGAIGDNEWGFGQILPIFAILIPTYRTIRIIPRLFMLWIKETWLYRLLAAIFRVLFRVIWALKSYLVMIAFLIHVELRYRFSRLAYKVGQFSSSSNVHAEKLPV